MKSLFKTVFLIIFFSVITRIAGFFFRIYLSRTIGAEALGIYQISYSIFSVLLTLVCSGLPLVISKLTAKHIINKDKAAERKVLTTSMIIAISISILLCLFVLAFSPLLKLLFTEQRCIQILIILLPSLIFSAIYSTVRGNMWGHNDYFSVCIAELFEQVVRIILCVILLSGIFTVIDGALGAALSMTIACLLSAIFVLILYLCKGGKFAKPNDKKLYKELIKTTAPISGVRVATSLVQPIIALIIPLRLVAYGYTTSQAISLFGIAIGMTMPLLFIPTTLIGSLSMALVPDLSSAVTKQNESHISSRIISSLKFTAFVSCMLIPIYMGAGEFIGKFFFDNVQSGVLLASSAWIMLPMGITNITSTILNSVGLEVKSFRNYIIGAVLMLFSIWFLPKLVGINALIWAMGLCFSAAAILNLRMIRKFVTPELKIKKSLVLLCLFVIPACAITSFLTNILNHFIPLFFNLAISSIVSVLFYLGLCMIFNVLEIRGLFVEFKNSKLSKFKIKKKPAKV